MTDIWQYDAETHWEKTRTVICGVVVLVVGTILFYGVLYLLYLVAVAAATAYVGH